MKKYKIKAPPQTKGNAYEQKFNSKIKMPHDWSSAILSAKKSKFLKETLGPDLHKAFIAIKGNGISKSSKHSFRIRYRFIFKCYLIFSLEIFQIQLSPF